MLTGLIDSRIRRAIAGAAIAAAVFAAGSFQAQAGGAQAAMPASAVATADQATVIALLTSTTASGPRDSGPTTANATRGLDEKWGDPLKADLFDTRSVHGRLNYYYIAGQQGTQSGIGFTLTFPN